MDTANIIILLLNIVLFVMMIVFHYLGYKETEYSVKDYKSGLGGYFFTSRMCWLTGGFFTYMFARNFFDIEVGWPTTIATLIVFIATYIILYTYFLKKVKQNEAAKGSETNK